MDHMPSFSSGGYNRGYNSYGGSSKKARILRVVEESEIELPPREIAKRTGINPTTTKIYLRQLLAEGKVVQPYPGFYCSNSIHGVLFAPLRVHNVILTSDAPWLDFSDDVSEMVGDVKVRVQFGLWRHNITGRISCDQGMDKRAVLFALQRFFDLVKARTGHDLENVTVKTFELNRDLQGVRVDCSPEKGTFCYTKEGLFGVVERLYQKDEGTVRHENKVSKAMTVDELTVLLQEGVSGYNTQQGLYAVVKEVGKLAEAVKFQNRVVYDQQAGLQQLLALSGEQLKTMQTFAKAMEEHLTLVRSLQEVSKSLQAGFDAYKHLGVAIENQSALQGTMLKQIGVTTRLIDALQPLVKGREEEGRETVGSTHALVHAPVPSSVPMISTGDKPDQKRFINPPAPAGSICPWLKGIKCTAMDPPAIPSCIITDYCMNPRVYPGCPYRGGGHRP